MADPEVCADNLARLRRHQYNIDARVEIANKRHIANGRHTDTYSSLEREGNVTANACADLNDIFPSVGFTTCPAQSKNLERVKKHLFGEWLELARKIRHTIQEEEMALELCSFEVDDPIFIRGVTCLGLPVEFAE